MGAVLIGVGLAIAVIGLVLGTVGFGSSETTSGAALLTAGSIGFVGGILFLGLGFIHRALVDIAQRLDGVVHFEPEEEAATESAVVLETVRDDFSPVIAPREEKVHPPVVAPKRAPTPEPEPELEPEPLVTSPVAVEDEKPARGGGLPSWFRRKREADAEAGAEPEETPVAEPRVSSRDALEAATKSEPELEPLPPFRPSSEPPRRELPGFLRTGNAAAPAERPSEPRFPDLRFGEPRTSEPRITEPRTSESRITEPRTPEPRVPEFRGPEPRAPESRITESRSPELPAPRDEFEPGPPPTFLRESDLLGEEEPAVPEVTVLKAGTIGGMAYKLFSDGSIEADLPDGTLRFGSLQELREHVAGSASRSEG